MRPSKVRAGVDDLRAREDFLGDRRKDLKAEIKKQVTSHSAGFYQQEIRELRADLARTELDLEENGERLDALKEQLPSPEEVEAATARLEVLEQESEERIDKFVVAWGAFAEALLAAKEAGGRVNGLRHQGREAFSEAEELEGITGVPASVAVPVPAPESWRWAALTASWLEAVAVGGDLSLINAELGGNVATTKAA